MALAFVFGFAGFAWAAIALAVGSGPLPVFAVLAIAAFACFAAAYGLLAFQRWAAIVAAVAFLGSLGLGFVVYLAIRSAFATYPF